MIKTEKQIKKENLKKNLQLFFDDSYLDVQGLTPSVSSSLDEQYLARVLTKLAIGSATVWWSIIEMKDFFVLRKKAKGIIDELS